MIEILSAIGQGFLLALLWALIIGLYAVMVYGLFALSWWILDKLYQLINPRHESLVEWILRERKRKP